MFKTIFFGIVVNVLILTAISFIVYFTGLDIYLAENFGTGYQSIFIFCFTNLLILDAKQQQRFGRINSKVDRKLV